MNSTNIEYLVVFQNPTYIGADVELSLRQEDIPPVPSLNIMSPKFHAVPLHSGLKNGLEPLAIALMQSDLDEGSVVAERS